MSSNPNQSVAPWKTALALLTAVVLTIIVLKGPKEKEISAPIEKQAEPVAEEKAPPDLKHLFAPETLVAEGQFVIFGTDRPAMETSPSGKYDRMPIGKGKCSHCHIFVEGQRQDIGPNLIGLEKRSHTRIKEARYNMFSEKYGDKAEPLSGLVPKAQTGGEYLLESIYCPSCYIVEGYGTAENAMVSKMPVMHHMPYELNDYQMIAVASYLQAKETPGDLSKVTAKEDWLNYFKKELPLPDDSPKIYASSVGLAITEKLTDSVEEIIQKNGCFVCHRIPGIGFARTGLIGPILAMKSTAPMRLASKGYQEAVTAGRASATTARAYVKESILKPAAYIPRGFRAGDSGMPSDYSHKMTLGDVDRLVDFLMTIDDAQIKQEKLSASVGQDNATE